MNEELSLLQNKPVVSFIILSLAIIIIDSTVINTIFKKIWNKTVLSIQGSELLVTNFIYPILAYICIILGVYFFVFPKISDKNWVIDCILWGFLWGILVYGVFDFTNLSIFSKYDISTAFIDIFWGGIMISFSTFITYFILHYS